MKVTIKAIAFVFSALLLSMPLAAPARTLSASSLTASEAAPTELISLDVASTTSPNSRSLQSLPAIARGLGVAVSVLGSLAEALDITEQALDKLLSASSVSVSQPQKGAVWVTSLDGDWGSWTGQVLSAYYHPTRDHTATTVGKLGTKKSTAGPKQWAVSKQTRGLWGNKAYYNTL